MQGYLGMAAGAIHLRVDLGGCNVAAPKPDFDTTPRDFLAATLFSSCGSKSMSFKASFSEQREYW